MAAKTADMFLMVGLPDLDSIRSPNAAVNLEASRIWRIDIYGILQYHVLAG
jgi:hypothetical protein